MTTANELFSKQIKLRKAILLKMYELSGCIDTQLVEFTKSVSSVTEEDTTATINYLVNEGLIKIADKDSLLLTHQGIKIVESYFSEEKKIISFLGIKLWIQ